MCVHLQFIRSHCIHHDSEEEYSNTPLLDGNLQTAGITRLEVFIKCCAYCGSVGFISFEKIVQFLRVPIVLLLNVNLWFVQTEKEPRETMERYHIYKLGLAVFFCLIYLARVAVIDGLRINDLIENATDNRERRDAVVDSVPYKSDSDGTPGVDYPNLAYVPKTRFSCRDMETGYYADLETDCQVFHICDEGRKISFLCPNGTIFQQLELICDWWFKVNCTTSPLLYEESAEILVRENAKRKESRRVSNKGNKQTIFSSGENYQEHSSQSTTPAHFITPSYRNQYYDRKFATTTDNSIQVRRGDRRLDYDTNHQSEQFSANRANNYITSSNADNNYHQRFQGTATNNDNTHSRFITNRTPERNNDIKQVKQNKNNLHLNNKTEKFIIRPNQLKSNFNTNGHKASSYYDSYENQREDESQELQETASFVKNYRNDKVINNINEKATTFYPNHRQTYSEIKDPRYYVEKPYNKLPDKPFYGFSTTPQVLSTIPVTVQNDKFTTERYFNFQQYTNPTPSQSIYSTTEKYLRKNVDGHLQEKYHFNDVPVTSTFNLPKNSNLGSENVVSNYTSSSKLLTAPTSTKQYLALSSTPTSNNIVASKSINHNRNNGINEYSGKSLFESYSTTAQYNQASTDSPVISFNIIPLTARPPYELKKRKEKTFADSPRTQIILINNTTSSKSALPLQIPTDGEYEENIFSMNFKNPQQKYSNIPKNHKLSENSGTSNLADIERNRKNQPFRSTTAPYIYEKPEVPYITGRPSSSTFSPNSNNTSSFDNIRFIVNNRTFKINENSNRRQNISTDVVFNDNTGSTTESQPTNAVRININSEIYSTPITPSEQEDNVVNPLSISNNPNILYTSPSTILQPQPFSFAHTQKNPATISSIISSNPSGVPHLQIYTVSTSSPFLTADRNLLPTLPTPYLTTPDYEKTSKLVNENVNNMISSLMQVVKDYNNNFDNVDLNTPRPGLVVPPSVGPDTLRTLAIYFASALDNMTASSNFSSKELDEFEEGSSTSHINNEKLIKAFLTQMTRQNYESLFNTPMEDLGTTEATAVLTTESGNSENDLIKEDSKNLVDDLTVRQLARVFTEALSFYLDDPATFKKVLHEVRPKEPPSIDSNGDLNDAEDDEVLNYSDSDLKFDHLHLSTRPAATPVIPTWGYIIALNNSNKDSENTNSLSSEQENFQSADSQSFVSQFNKIKQEEKNKLMGQNLGKEYTENPLKIETNDDQGKTLPNDHWTTSLDVAKLWQNTLFVNPEVLNNNFNTTNTEVDSFELDTASTKYFTEDTSSEEVSIENALYSNIDETDIEYQLKKLAKHELNSTQVHNILSSFMNSNKSKKLDQLLNELNVSKKEFLEKMEEVETDPVNRQLILLLISKCNKDDDDNIQRENNNNNSDGFKISNVKLTKGNVETLNDRDIEQIDDGINIPNYDNEGFTESNIYKKIVDPSLKDDSEDTRALELLNSLYVIASKYGK